MLLRRVVTVVKATAGLKLTLRLSSYFCYKVPSNLLNHSRFVSDLPKSRSSQRQTAQTLFLQEKRSVGEVKPQRTGSAFVGVAPFPRKITYSCKTFL